MGAEGAGTGGPGGRAARLAWAVLGCSLLLAVVEQTFQPSRVMLWLRS